jgi:serine O-acetyltransferase
MSGEQQGPKTLRELAEYWAEDWRAHERDWTRPGFRAIAIYRFGNYRMHWPRYWRAPLSVGYRMLYRYARNHYGIELPYSAKIGRRVVIEHQGGIVVHGNTVVGDECVLRQGVTLGNRHLNAPFDAPVLGRRVNVGAGAQVLGKVHIGDGANLGANAVVLRDVPAGETAVGIPARILKDK